MKTYASKVLIPFETSRHLSGNMQDVLDHAMENMGRSLLKAVYRDLPQCFTQRNISELRSTEYIVEVVILDKAEYEQILYGRSINQPMSLQREV